MMMKVVMVMMMATAMVMTNGDDGDDDCHCDMGGSVGPSEGIPLLGHCAQARQFPGHGRSAERT